MTSYPARLNPVFDSRNVAAALNVVVPAPTVAVSQVRVHYRGAALAQRALAQRGLVPAAIHSTQFQKSSGGWTLQFGAAGGPKLVRYTADAGKTWTTLAIDAADSTLSMNTLPAHAQVEVAYGDGAVPEPWVELQ